MEAEVELQQMLVDATSDSPDGLLGDTGKDGVAQFLEKGSTDTGCAIYAFQSHRHVLCRVR